MSFLAPADLSYLATRLTEIVGGLRSVVAARGGRDHAAIPLVVLLWGRLGRLARRFEALMARLAAGRAARVRRPASPDALPCGPRPAAVRLSRSWASLCRFMPEANGAGSQLQFLVYDPRMAALLAAEPTAGRILRPLLRMLAVEVPAMAAPAAAEAVAASTAARRQVAPAPDRSARPEGGTVISPLPHKPPWTG